MTTDFRRLLAATALCLAAMPGLLRAETAEITLLHVNDVYEIAPKKGKGGFAQLMTLLERERAGARNSLTTFGGDLLSPSVMSGLTKGAQMIELMNAIRVDVAGLGNHEFDFGGQVLAERIASSRFTWLATNTLGADGKPFAGAQALMTRKVDDLTIGLFSLLTPETEHLSSPGQGVHFVPFMEAAEQAVADLKEAGADFVIALTHLDIAEDRALARQVRGIDVILGGHDHDPILFYQGGTLIMKAGYDAHYLAVADIRIEKAQTRRGPRVSMLPQWRFVSTAGVEPHAGVGDVVARYESELETELGVALGKSAVELDSLRAHVRTRETNMGNLIADAMRAALGTDVGLTNGGGIRGDRTYEPGTTLTRKDVLAELPFGNVGVSMELSGGDLRAAIENGVSRVEDTAGRFPQVSGMAFTYDPSRPQGNRIVEITVGGAPLDDARSYTVATNDYIAAGGDGYGALKNGRLIVDSSGGTLMASQVMSYIAARGTVAPQVEGRITATR
jgi:2',3'-cyclic-nucleotide 2'-phosphodiesterase (5'-nucleotidase family)